MPDSDDDEYTPVPPIEWHDNPFMAELAMALSTGKRQRIEIERLRLELAVKQALIDEQASEIRQLTIDRRALAAWVQQHKKGSK